MKFALFADGAPSTIAPPAEIIPLPVGSRDAMFAADKATIAPSGTEVPLISLIFVMVSVVAPGVVPFTTTVAGLAAAVAFVAVLVPHSIVTLGGPEIVGGVVSRTVILCTQFVLFPHWSVAVHVREITFAPPQLLLTESL